METVEEEDGHTPLLIVHWKTSIPTPKAVIPVVSNVGVVIVPAPDNKVHKPVPTTAVLPAMVAVVLAHTV